jgi:hypothetical protein
MIIGSNPRPTAVDSTEGLRHVKVVKSEALLAPRRMGTTAATTVAAAAQNLDLRRHIRRPNEEPLAARAARA